jgi:radical SAM protein with 4Fe4S-binding SPASM domain
MKIRIFKSSIPTPTQKPIVNNLPEDDSKQDKTILDISWIDEFLTKIKPFIYVREMDNLLILIPNQSYNLNASAVAILSYLLKGNPVAGLLREIGDSEDKRREIHYFFCDLRSLVNGCLRDHDQRKAIIYKEYDRSAHQYPVLSELAVTYRCNLNCEFCYVGKKKSPELSSADLKKILFKILHEVRIPSVSFTGGEPLLRDDLSTLVSYAARIGLWTNLITNGTLLDEPKVAELKAAGLASGQVSIEGPNAATHDLLTGIDGAFEKTLNGIKLLQARGIPVHTNTTVSRRNLDRLEEIIVLAKSLGLPRLSMNLMIPCGSAGDRPDLWVPYTEIGPHILKLKRRAEKEGIRFLWYSPIPVCHFNPIAHGLGNKSCAAITDLLSIDPGGNVIPCSSWPEPVGSLLNSSFKNIWDSAARAYFHNAEYAPGECRACVRFDACKGACPLYWDAYRSSRSENSRVVVRPITGARSA